VSRMGVGEVHTFVLVGDLSERDHLEDLSVEGSVVLEQIII